MRDEEEKMVVEETMATTKASEVAECFRLTDITDAIQTCNFNKGLGPDCFDGNVIQTNEVLCQKIAYEILDALNLRDIPRYLQLGRMVPLQKTSGKGPVALDEIRPIVVRSHIAKIMEKAILAKIKEEAPHLLAS